MDWKTKSVNRVLLYRDNYKGPCVTSSGQDIILEWQLSTKYVRSTFRCHACHKLALRCKGSDFCPLKTTCHSTHFSNDFLSTCLQSNVLRILAIHGDKFQWNLLVNNVFWPTLQASWKLTASCHQDRLYRPIYLYWFRWTDIGYRHHISIKSHRHANPGHAHVHKITEQNVPVASVLASYLSRILTSICSRSIWRIWMLIVHLIMQQRRIIIEWTCKKYTPRLNRWIAGTHWVITEGLKRDELSI